MRDLKTKLARLPSLKSSGNRPSKTSEPSNEFGFDHELGFGRRWFTFEPNKQNDWHLLKDSSPDYVIEDALKISPDVLSAYRGPIFLDTETTGLGHGASTYPFLIGLTYWGQTAWYGEQLFLSSPVHERAMLQYLLDRIKDAKIIITFNGKSYDIPLLNTRMRLHRLPLIEPTAHLDLYHLLRGVLKHQMSRCRLIDFETSILKFYRVGDIDGADIPAAYFSFLHGHDCGAIGQVVEHNEYDVRSMVHLLTWYLRVVVSASGDSDDRLEYAFLAKLVNRATSPWVVERLDDLLNRSHDSWLKTRCARLVYEAKHRTNLVQAMAVLLDHYAECDLPLRSFFARRLSIHFEHEYKQLRAALRYASDTELDEGMSAHQKRINRLRSKLNVLEGTSEVEFHERFESMFECLSSAR
ncbi:MAG: ribonuclease H-like domain-containing protein [Bradymonadia bacterium]